jgi:hypothetical protein
MILRYINKVLNNSKTILNKYMHINLDDSVYSTEILLLNHLKLLGECYNINKLLLFSISNIRKLSNPKKKKSFSDIVVIIIYGLSFSFFFESIYDNLFKLYNFNEEKKLLYCDRITYAL